LGLCVEMLNETYTTPVLASRVTRRSPMTRGTGVVLAMAATVLTLASPSFADDPFQCPRPGTVLTWSSGGRVTIGDQDGFTCVAKEANGRLLRRSLGFIGNPEFASSHGEKLYPFRVGNQVEFDRMATHISASSIVTNSLVVAHDVVRVVRQERVTTKAGTFSAFVIEQRESPVRADSATWTLLDTYWWAPQLGYAVKHVTEMNGRVTGQFEVTEWKQP
jgi:hypothetical protein